MLPGVSPGGGGRTVGDERPRAQLLQPTGAGGGGGGSGG